MGDYCDGGGGGGGGGGGDDDDDDNGKEHLSREVWISTTKHI
jgi:hypothetical protein